eukprot:798076-Amphidinium_carterae.2
MCVEEDDEFVEEKPRRKGPHVLLQLSKCQFSYGMAFEELRHQALQTTCLSHSVRNSPSLQRKSRNHPNPQ